MQVGKKNRSVGATLMNQDSSRSHSIFTITVEKLQQGDGKVSPDTLVLSYCNTQHTHWSLLSALWYWVIAVQTFMNVGLQVAERVLHRIAAIPFAQADKSATPLLSHCLLHRERQGYLQLSHSIVMTLAAIELLP